MIFRRWMAVLALATPAFSQYAGPAVLTRGQAPAAMQTAQIDFRPFLEIQGGYETGLNGVGVDPQGKPVNQSSVGYTAHAGVSGLHSWRHTQVGLDFTAAITHYSKLPFYDNTNETLLLGITHQFTRHVTLSSRTSAGLYSRSFVTPNLPATVPFDPATTYIPTNDFFDNRTMYFSTQADLQVQHSLRLSYSIGADGFSTRRRSTALFGVMGGGARSDIQYRVSRRSTVGVGYTYTHFSFSRIFSSTDLHSFVGSYAIRMTRALELSMVGGGTQFETKFIQTVPIDPAIAALIGISAARQVSYQKNWQPNVSGRLSYTMHRGVIFATGGHSITPGNGLFLTSSMTQASAGYTYTALKKWTSNISGSYTDAESLGNYVGNYGNFTATLNVSRQVYRYTHLTLSANARKYTSGDFRAYNKWAYGVHLGLGFTPGDVPIRLW